MPALSKKGHSMPESPIRKLVPFAENAKARGTEVIHLNIGQPDIKTPQIALDAVSNAKIEVLAYSRTEGLRCLQRQIGPVLQTTPGRRYKRRYYSNYWRI